MSIATTANIHHATRAKAERLATMLEAEYPRLSIAPSHNEDGSQILAWIAMHDGNVQMATYPKVPELADLLDAAEQLGLEIEADEDEQKDGGSVVPSHYRAQYREASTNGQTCGDWLAEWLVAETHGIDGFSVEEFAAIVDKNRLDTTAKWAKLPESGQKGWIGRYRMNGRQALEKEVSLTGFVVDARGVEHAIPADALDVLRGKHAKWIAKETKRREAILEALREA